MRAIWLLALAACEQASSATPAPAVAPPAPLPHDLAVTLERTYCNGDCPVYRLAIYRDGVVQFTGVEYVDVKGPAIGHITQRELAELDRLFASAHYFDLSDRYTQFDVSDRPAAFTSYQLGARAKQIDHYYGDESAPRVLEELEGEIDRIAGSERWIGNR